MISIVVPVYNSAPYLDICLESIHNQTYSDWECILVDDGSKDASGEICDAWTKKDSRFKVIHQKNEGAAAARNNGISISRGSHIAFIDSDDWVEKEYIEELSNNHGADYVVSGLVIDRINGETITHMPAKTQYQQFDSQVNIDDLVVEGLFYSPCIKLFKSEIIRSNNILFPTEKIFGEDLQFNFNYLAHCKSIYSINSAKYHYRKMEENTLSTIHRDDQFANDYEQWILQYNFYMSRNMMNESIETFLYRRLWGQTYDGLFMYPSIAHPTIKYIKTLLSADHISDLDSHQDLFQCAKWIKWAIIHRQAWIFYFYFEIKKLLWK